MARQDRVLIGCLVSPDIVKHLIHKALKAIAVGAAVVFPLVANLNTPIVSALSGSILFLGQPNTTLATTVQIILPPKTVIVVGTPQIKETGCGGMLAQEMSSSSVRAYVVCESSLLSLTPTEQFQALWIINHESLDCWQDGTFNTSILGDDGNSRGCWQISKIWHPEVSNATANSLASSTLWSLTQLKNGDANEWSTWKFRCKRYGLCQK